jgi:antitoxin (DNA-binding transcriptional repressor) of toxin-antitoxin stability system
MPFVDKKFHLSYHSNVHLSEIFMDKTISIKELRNNISAIATKVKNGQSYVVIRRSKPVFKLIPTYFEADEAQWETVVDFTEGGKKKGAKIEDVLAALKRLNKS